MASRTRRCAAPLIALLVCALVAGFVTAPSSALAGKTQASSAPNLYVPSAILVTADGDVLYAKNADAKRRPASTIKMLNALVVRENASLDQTITVSQKAEMIDDGVVGLKAGQKLTVRQLLAVMLIHSANGAAEALAGGIGGNEKKYVAMMNAKAMSLGLTHTRAADPHGLSPKNTSSAADLSVIARALMADSALRGIVRSSSARLPWGKYWTTDDMLGSYAGIEGVKTGYTDPAGYCFVSAAKRNGVELFGVVLGAEVGSDRFTQTRKLLDWGFAHSKQREFVSVATTMGVVEVAGGWEPTVTVHAEKPLSMTVFDYAAPATTMIVLPARVQAPVRAGQPVGEAQVVRAGKVVATVALKADTTVERDPDADKPDAGAVSVQLRDGAQTPSFWQQIAGVWAGLGRMLGV